MESFFFCLLFLLVSFFNFPSFSLPITQAGRTPHGERPAPHGARSYGVCSLFVIDFPFSLSFLSFFISYRNANHEREVITRGGGQSRRMRDATREARGVTREGVRRGKNNKEEKETVASEGLEEKQEDTRRDKESATIERTKHANSTKQVIE
jgi:hypothetical protein